jgi:EAL domain-containing protein (putative c-di-GMP-specific phosphodiesterase class I)
MDVDFLKIDGSLIKNIDTDKNSYLVVETIVSFADKLGIKTIAEFVHSSTVMDKVKDMGIDYSQGYHIDKPSLILE